MFLFTILTIAVNSRLYDLNQSKNLFDQFKNDFSKVYETTQIETLKFKTFIQNIELINTLNLQHDETVEFAITEFADMTQSEFTT